MKQMQEVPDVLEYAVGLYEELGGVEIAILDCLGFIRLLTPCKLLILQSGRIAKNTTKGKLRYTAGTLAASSWTGYARRTRAKLKLLPHGDLLPTGFLGSPTKPPILPCTLVSSRRKPPLVSGAASCGASLDRLHPLREPERTVW